MFSTRRATTRRTPIRTTLAVIAVTGTTAALLTACSSGAASDEVPVLTMATLSAPPTLDPIKSANGGLQTTISSLTYEPLIQKEPDGSYSPGLAEQWGYVDGSQGKKYELTLRSGAEFADGSPVDADAVAASINYFAKNATGPSANSFKTLSATAEGAGKVAISSSTPNPIITDLLTPFNLGGNVMSPAGLKADRSNATYGAGPYVYSASQSVTGDHYTFVPNKTYFDASKVKFSKVIVKVIASNASALQALRSGQVDLMAGDTTQLAAAKSAGFTITSSSSSFSPIWLLDFGGALTPALGDQRVRQALNYAIDRKSIAKAVYGSAGSALMQPNTTGWDAYDKSLEDAYPYDPAKAKSLLAAAGYADGFTFSDVYWSAQPDTTKIAQAVAQQLAEVGVTMKLVPAPTISELVAAVNTKQHSATSLEWGGQTQYGQYNQVWAKGSFLNPWNAEIDGMAPLLDTYTTASGDALTDAAQAMEQTIVDQAVSIPIATFDSIYFTTKDLKGFESGPSGSPNDPTHWSLAD